MPTRFSSLHVPVKTLASLPQRRVDLAKPGRQRDGIQISGRLISDILRPVKNLRLLRG